MSDPNGGWHYLCALGYRTTESDKRIIQFRNSWGPRWGMSGDGEGSEEFIAGWIDIYVMSIVRQENG